MHQGTTNQVGRLSACLAFDHAAKGVRTEPGNSECANGDSTVQKALGV